MSNEGKKILTSFNLKCSNCITKQIMIVDLFCIIIKRLIIMFKTKSKTIKRQILIIYNTISHINSNFSFLWLLRLSKS